MTQRVLWPFGLAVVFLAGIGTTQAGVQARARVCWLGTGVWQLREKEGKVSLVVCSWQRSSRLPEAERHKWYVSAPTIKSASGKFLGTDPEGRTPSVSLFKDKGANTRWVFDIVANYNPEQAKGERRGMQKGQSGFRFRVKMAEGRFKNWYLAAEELTEEQQEGKGDGPLTRRLKLVREPREATVFTYIASNYYVDHK